MNSLDEVLPSELETFLNYVVSGDAKMDKGDKMKRIGQVIICFLVYVNLISLTFSFPRTKMWSHYIQDICRAATNGEWKLPKHILLCTTVHHLYRSKLLTTILARLGHCKTYDFGLELEKKKSDLWRNFIITKHLTLPSGDILVMLYVGYVIFFKTWNNLGRSKSHTILIKLILLSFLGVLAINGQLGLR